ALFAELMTHGPCPGRHGSGKRARSAVRPLIASLIAGGIIENAPRPDETFPSVAVAFRASAGGRHRVIRLETATAALQLENYRGAMVMLERVIRRKVTLRHEFVHAD